MTEIEASANAAAAMILPLMIAPRDGRCGEQRLERLPFALAGRRVDGHLHAADEREQQQQIGHELLREIEACLGPRNVALADLQGAGDAGMNAARNQPQAAELARVRVQQAPRAADRRAALQRPRAVEDQLDARGAAGTPVLRITSR